MHGHHYLRTTKVPASPFFDVGEFHISSFQHNRPPIASGSFLFFVPPSFLT
jgi:hypothetical protein